MVAEYNGNTKVKKTLISGIAALFLATGAAHARTTRLPLTEPIIGYWCQSQEQHFGETVYKRGASDCDGNLTFEYDHYDADFWDGKNTCTFLDMRYVDKKDGGYLMRLDCVSDKNIWSQDTIKLRIIDGLLHLQVINFNPSHPGCGIADTSHGFLYLQDRNRPYYVTAKLLPGARFRIIDQSVDGWRVLVTAAGPNMSGWIGAEYFKQVRCDEEKPKDESHEKAGN